MELRGWVDEAAAPPPGEDSPLAAMISAGAVQAAMDKLAVIRSNRELGASWAVIGRAEGGLPPKAAKRKAKRLERRTRRAWYLQQNQDDHGG